MGLRCSNRPRPSGPKAHARICQRTQIWWVYLRRCKSACNTDKAFSDPDFEKKYTKIKLPKLSNNVECYIDGVGKSGQKVIMGTLNLGKLGWQLNLQRRFRTVEIFVLRDFQAPE
jgi:hypothetical protein